MNEKLLYGIIGGVIGALLVVLLSNYSVNSRNYAMMNMMGMREMSNMMSEEMEDSMINHMDEMMDHGEEMSMDNMTESLVGLEGEEFEKVFIELMIAHHQGAIDMANLIPSRSERPELRKLGEDIITAQTAEIEMMKGWLRDWFND